MKILFICKHNRFRSVVGEVIFNALNKNPNIIAESAGPSASTCRQFINPEVIQVMRDKGYFIDATRKPRQVTSELVKDYDLVVIVADDVDPKFFSDYSGKIILWKISDVTEANEEQITDRVNKIEKRVRALVKKMEKE